MKPAEMQRIYKVAVNNILLKRPHRTRLQAAAATNR